MCFLKSDDFLCGRPTHPTFQGSHVFDRDAKELGECRRRSACANLFEPCWEILKHALGGLFGTHPGENEVNVNAQVWSLCSKNSQLSIGKCIATLSLRKSSLREAKKFSDFDVFADAKCAFQTRNAFQKRIHEEPLQVNTILTKVNTLLFDEL